MEECWDDEEYTPPPSSNAYKESVYVPPGKRVSESGRNSEWNSNRTREPYRNQDTDSWREKPRGNNRQFSSRGRKQYSHDGYNTNSAWKQNEEATEIEIGSNFVGKVIGRGGSKIQELERESGARIKVLQNDSSDETTPVRLTGSSESREKAKNLIEELTSNFGRTTITNEGGDNSWYGNSYASSTDDGPKLIDWDSLNKSCEEARQRKLAALPPIIKEFYFEDPAVAAMSPREVSAFRASNNSISVVKINPDDERRIPNPVSTFDHAFQHYPELLVELKKQGFTTPSPIQCQAWPIIMKGYDMIGIAQTGTGKTIAFLFPALIHIVGQVTPRSQRLGPSCLILAPTRELAQQIEVEAKKYTYHNITSVCVYGGGSRRNQIGIVTKGVDIVIATPGRLNDLVMNKIIDVTSVTYLVLDEADRMLDMGFEPQIRKVLLDVRPDRQTIMTSATWTNEVQELAARYMTNPFKVNVGALDLAAVHSVSQEIIFAEDEDRRNLLNEFIANMSPNDKAIVFVERKSVADDVASDLVLRGVECQSIHGDREQCDREQALDDLKTGYVRILIATDVASRGLDIKDITHIFNMYFPHNIEEYVHRVGRTGRAGRTGIAISIFTRQDWMHAEGLIRILEEANQFVPDELYDMANRYRAWRRKKEAEDAAVGGRRFRGGGRSRRF
ncbi:probable ATP-dependent RNA helicase DDX43 [Stegodyphus dumicola]|uniref:probable ATP-dependent RNA helicase DDX43 n=1 Tax=Stegodyphus dumicola TaxID=202533 RepID=UPI0015ABEE51|nr:probable ATP-dependent RNA helicase DDX43 [Stegodyphus dumicola]